MNTVKNFTESDLKDWANGKALHTNELELIHAPLDWQKMGLYQTRSGYGAKLTSQYKIQYCGKFYRIYTSCYSNVGSNYIICKKQYIYIV